jgi:SNF2 family DNA or RNA helicase
MGGQSDEATAVHDFETGKYGVIGLTIQSGATALNLFRSDYVLMVDEAWTVDDNEQAYNRVRNTEKSNPISVDRFRVAGSICERVHEILERDQKIISSVIDSAHGETYEVDLDRLANLGAM